MGAISKLNDAACIESQHAFLDSWRLEKKIQSFARSSTIETKILGLDAKTSCFRREFVFWKQMWGCFEQESVLLSVCVLSIVKVRKKTENNEMDGGSIVEVWCKAVASQLLF